MDGSARSASTRTSFSGNGAFDDRIEAAAAINTAANPSICQGRSLEAEAPDIVVSSCIECSVGATL